ncbi:uncharacterized protein DNG_04144 [Cephalotrichum gorgonifer]|uniref:Uncharacterized protein n=1 Tax=Cephalotrichum gorgonifer TaxID=2041049 RepID=A0AAE8SUX0_9PEZI|nr:uncharacterized protein DNG_04144 [Cephalotrichum gorgonifer]
MIIITSVSISISIRTRTPSYRPLSAHVWRNRYPRAPTPSPAQPRFTRSRSTITSMTDRTTAFRSRPLTPTPTPTRRALTTVVLPNRRFLVSRPLMDHLLPRAANAPHHGAPFSPIAFLGPTAPARLPPHLFPDPIPPLTDALTLLFERLERISREEDAAPSSSHSFFDGLEFRLDNVRDQPRVLVETFRVAFALCVVLDMDGGLGCADELAAHLGRFLARLLPRLYVLGGDGPGPGPGPGPEGGVSGAVCGALLGYAKVFRETGECLEVLGALWDGLDAGERVMWMALGRLGLL